MRRAFSTTGTIGRRAYFFGYLLPTAIVGTAAFAALDAKNNTIAFTALVAAVAAIWALLAGSAKRARDIGHPAFMVAGDFAVDSPLMLGALAAVPIFPPLNLIATAYLCLMKSVERSINDAQRTHGGR